MFIKKDLRRIEEIIHDPGESIQELKFSKRSSEFNGTISVLTEEKHLQRMTNLLKLNLYDNSLHSLFGIEKFQALSGLQEINLGNNQLSQLPSEVECFNINVSQLKDSGIVVRVIAESTCSVVR